MNNPDPEMNFCRRCGTKLMFHEESAYHCENGHTIDFTELHADEIRQSVKKLQEIFP